jgi:iron complex outermembrane receptor protein
VGVDGSEMRDRFSMLGATWDRTLSPAHALRVTGSLNAYAYRGAFMYDSVRNNDFANGRWAIVDAQHTTTALPRHRLVSGVQLIRSVGQEQGYFTAGTRTFADDARESILAAYVQDEFRLTERWIVNGGLRLDRYTSFGTAFNPRLALIRTFRRGSAVKLLYGRAFRAPSVFERRYEGPDVRPNALLRPERIETIELLAEHLVSANWKVTTALFRNDASQLIGLEDADIDVVQYRNSRSARAQGIEGEVEFERQGVRARATGVLQRATARPGDATLPNAPHTLATVDLTIPVSRRIGGSIELRHVGARRSALDTPIDAYTVANAWLSIRLPVAGARLGAGVYNLLDARYDDPASADFRQTAIPQAPRHVRVSLDVGTR